MQFFQYIKFDGREMGGEREREEEHNKKRWKKLTHE